MRIAFISYWSCPLTRLGVLSAGGMNVFLFNLANSLKDSSVQVDIYTRSHSEKHESVIYLSKKNCLIHLPVKLSDHYKGSLQFAGMIISYIMENKISYDLIHSHYFYSGLSGLILKNSLSVPLVNSFHTLGVMKQKYAGIYDKKRILAEKEIVKEADILLASTNLEKNDLLKNYSAKTGKIYTVNPGVDHRIFKPFDKLTSRKKINLSSNYKYILFVGRIDPVKGITLLLDAVCQLKEKYPRFRKNTRLLIIGGDVRKRNFWMSKETEKIKNFIKDKKLSDCTDFLGSIAHNKLPLYYSSADLVILPSVYESFGLVILEAMACGAAVLASKVGGLKYLVKDGKNGMLFKNGNILDLKDKMFRLLMDSDKRKLLGQNAYKYSLHFSWERQTDKILSIYKNII